MTMSERCAPTVGEFPAKVYGLVAQYQAKNKESEDTSPEELDS